MEYEGVLENRNGFKNLIMPYFSYFKGSGNFVCKSGFFFGFCFFLKLHPKNVLKIPLIIIFISLILLTNENRDYPKLMSTSVTVLRQPSL
jgi:hypothetical protein